jgi:hypothetical protein
MSTALPQEGQKRAAPGTSLPQAGQLIIAAQYITGPSYIVEVTRAAAL